MISQFIYYGVYMKKKLGKKEDDQAPLLDGATATTAVSSIALLIVPFIFKPTNSFSDRTLMAESNPSNTILIGSIVAWTSAACYVTSRIPQLYKNVIFLLTS